MCDAGPIRKGNLRNAAQTEAIAGLRIDARQ
jgi:hypothetical protein